MNRCVKYALLLAALVAIFGPGAEVALAPPSGGVCWPQEQGASFTPSIAEAGSQIAYSYFYTREGCTPSTAYPCNDYEEEGELRYSAYDRDYVVTLWWKYGTPEQLQLGSQSISAPRSGMGFVDRVDASGSFTVPEGATGGAHELTFVMNETVTAYCGDQFVYDRHLEPVVSSFQLSVQGDAYGISGTGNTVAPTRLPSTGSESGSVLLILGGGGLILLFYLGNGRRSGSSR